MTKSVPLIRAAVLGPMIRWLRANGLPVRDCLQLADLGYISDNESDLPIPLFFVLDLFRKLAAINGPDIAARVITEHSIADLGKFGAVILRSRTPREALLRVVAALPRYSTHEMISLLPIPGGLCVQAGWSLVLDDETLHLTQQFTAALLQRLCAATAHGQRTPRNIRIRAHPRYGVEHLGSLFGSALAASDQMTLAVELDDDVLDAAFPFDANGPAMAAAEEWDFLNGGASFCSSARIALAPMAVEPTRSFARLVRASGMSVRSLQRVLTSEGTSFRQLSDELQREKALHALVMGPGAISTAATDAGYSAQSSLSRAVRRWTGSSPKSFRPRQSVAPTN